MNSVERPDRLARKRLPRTVDDLAADSKDVPMRGGCREMGAATGRVSLGQVSECSGANQYSIAFNQRQIGCNDDVGFGKVLANG